MRCVDKGVRDRAAPDPVDQRGDPDRDDDEKPLAQRVDHRRMPDEQVALDFSILRRFLRAEIGVAETALDRGSLDGLSADGARLGVVAHVASLSQR
jgi:hypothetical protein